MNRRAGALPAALCLIAALPFAARWDPVAQDREHILAPPGVAGHWLGTDELGRDLWARYAHGARWSIGVGAAAVAAALSIGVVLGSAAGWYGGWTDKAILAATNVVVATPWIFMLLALRSAIPLDWNARRTAAATLCIVALLSWPKPAQVIRAVVLSAVRSDFVQAARGFGLAPVAILRSHVVPETAGVLLAQALLLLPRFVLADLTLSAFGLGISDPDPGWGALLLPLRSVWLLRQDWWLMLPALLMAPFFAAAAIAGRALEGELRRRR